MRIAIASCKQLPEPDHDEAALSAALAARGFEVSVLAWDDPAAPFALADLVLIRSTWNYHRELLRFLGWLSATSAATRVKNPFSVVKWNSDKTYLAGLAARGICIIPTEFVARGTPARVDEVARAHGFRDRIVIKPVVSAGSYGTAVFASSETGRAQEFLQALTTDSDAMIQPWIPAVETSGERCLVWIDGVVTHAVRKAPRLAGDAEKVSADVDIADDERALAERVLVPFKDEILYARVDMVRDGDTLRVMEVELIEPSLFFHHSPAALRRFADGVVRRLAAQ